MMINIKFSLPFYYTPCVEKSFVRENSSSPHTFQPDKDLILKDIEIRYNFKKEGSVLVKITTIRKLGSN